jgi:hypothetical protein
MFSNYKSRFSIGFGSTATLKAISPQARYPS